MPRQRMVKPEFFDSDSLAECSHSARLAFIGLWVMGDDKGNVKLSIKKLRRQIFPLDDMSDAEFEGLLAELERVGCIKAYSVDGEEYVTTVNFLVYQTVKNPSKTNIPEPPSGLAKQRRTTRFQGVSPTPTLGEDQSCPSPTPALTHDRLPNKEVKKEEVFFPKEKNTSPRDSASVGAVAVRTAPPSAHCPMCEVKVWKNTQTGRYDCPNCFEAWSSEAVVMR